MKFKQDHDSFLCYDEGGDYVGFIRYNESAEDYKFTPDAIRSLSSSDLLQIRDRVVLLKVAHGS